MQIDKSIDIYFTDPLCVDFESLRLSLRYLAEIEEWIQTIDYIPAGNSVCLSLFLLLFSSWVFGDDTDKFAIDCICSSIWAKYLKLSLSLINITLWLQYSFPLCLKNFLCWGVCCLLWFYFFYFKTCVLNGTFTWASFQPGNWRMTKLISNLCLNLSQPQPRPPQPQPIGFFVNISWNKWNITPYTDNICIDCLY